jgi:hypothetical protein
MLTISTIAEALAELGKQTGRAWTDSELFDVATNRGVELHAAPPITAQTTIQKFVAGVGMGRNSAVSRVMQHWPCFFRGKLDNSG